MPARHHKRFCKISLGSSKDHLTSAYEPIQQTIVFVQANGDDENQDHAGPAQKLRITPPTTIPFKRGYRTADSTNQALVRQVRKGVVSYGFGTAVHIGCGVFLTAAHNLRCEWERKWDEMTIRIYRPDQRMTVKDKLAILLHRAGKGFGYKHAKLAAKGLIGDSHLATVVAYNDNVLQEQGWMPKDYAFPHKENNLALLSTAASGFIPAIGVTPGMYIHGEDTELVAVNLPLGDEEKEDLVTSLPDRITESDVEELAPEFFPWRLTAARGKSSIGLTLDLLEGLETDQHALGEIIITNIASLNGSSGGGLFNLLGELIGIHIGGVYGRLHTYPALHAIAVSFESPIFQHFFNKFGYPLLDDRYKHRWGALLPAAFDAEPESQVFSGSTEKIENSGTRGVRATGTAQFGAKKHGGTGYTFIEQ